MSNVHALSGVVPPGEANQDAIDMIELVLERLRSGEVVGIAYATVKPNGEGTHGWNCPAKMGNDLFAGIHRMSHCMLSGMED